MGHTRWGGGGGSVSVALFPHLSVQRLNYLKIYEDGESLSQSGLLPDSPILGITLLLLCRGSLD